MRNCYFLSWNVRGLRKMEKVRAVCRTIRTSKASVVFLQESKMSTLKQRVIERLKNKILREVAIVPSEGASGGLISMWDSKFFVVERNMELQRCIILVGTLSQWNLRVSLINVYAPNSQGERKDFLEQLACNIDALDLPTVIGGDFNAVKEAGKMWCGNKCYFINYVCKFHKHLEVDRFATFRGKVYLVQGW
ncbi:hypothetical protein HRI_001651400 [Hibiscus trionum]|uniref:Endonuclease/exonuclease/phosphatase domain-containing protein n=1 Tax=Hibiscus trionum TaxID=183268 RepID=A0A9W7LXK4_HIBTR|nr:hypothetical protein HRI_001651400 [Hibiscus trionum]